MRGYQSPGPLPARARAVAWRVIEAVAVICVPLMLLTSSVNTVINSTLLYEYGFSAYRAPEHTGISMDQLLAVAAQTREFFNAEDDLPLRATVLRGGQAVEIYSRREVDHMQDVRDLVRRVRATADFTLTYLLGLLGIGLWVRKILFLPLFIGILFQGAVITLGLVTLGGLASLFDFQAVFLQFHFLSFNNDLWMLDPTRDVLLMMYPWGFFRDATLAIGGLTAAVAALLLVSSKMSADRIGPLLPPQLPLRRP